MVIGLIISIALIAINIAWQYIDVITTRGARLTNFEMQGTDEGEDISRCYGPETRVNNPQVLWMDERIDERHTIKSGSGKNKVESKNWFYFQHAAVAICEGPITGITRVWANGKIFYDSSAPTEGAHRYTDITFYDGDTVQAADPLMESIEGEGEVPGYIGLAYMVVEKLALEDFGNNMPMFAFEVQGDEAVYYIADCIASICEYYGLTADQYDITGVANAQMNGYIVTDVGTGIDILSTLLFAYNIRKKERGGVIYFFDAGTEDEIQMDEDDIGAGIIGDERKLIEITDSNDTELPEEVHIQYVDPDSDLQMGSQSERRMNLATGNTESMSLPITLESDEARAIAARALWQAAQERQPGTITAMPNMLHIEENDILSVDAAGVKRQIRAMTTTRGNNFIMEAEGLVQSCFQGDSYAPAYLGVDPPGEGSGVPGQSGYEPPTMEQYLLDVPALSETEAVQAGYFYVHATDPAADPYLGVDYYQSFSETGTYDFLYSDNGQNIIGSTTSSLTASDDRWAWDDTNTVTVELLYGTLSSQEKDAVVRGNNWAMIRSAEGTEIIAYTTATYVSAYTYTLSGLLRGRRNSTIYSHSSGADFVLLSNGNLNYQQLGFSDVGTTRYIKVVPTGETTDDVSATTFAYTGECLQVLAPAHLKGTRAFSPADQDWTLTWHRLSRAPHRAFSGQEPEWIEAITTYVVYIMSGETVKWIEVLNTETFVYTEDRQDADFGSVQDTLKFRVLQYSYLFLANGPYTEITVSV